MAIDNEAIPDVSLTRVLKWAVVLVVAMGLGKKFWEMFGQKITSNLHRSLGE